MASFPAFPRPSSRSATDLIRGYVIPDDRAWPPCILCCDGHRYLTYKIGGYGDEAVAPLSKPLMTIRTISSMLHGNRVKVLT